MATLGTITVKLLMDTAQFFGATKLTETSINRFAKNSQNSLNSISTGFNTIAKRSAQAGAAAVGALSLLVKHSLDTNDKLAKTADKLGLTTEALAGLRHAAELSGVSSNTFDMALQRMTRRLAEAAVGTGEAKGALAELGLDAKKLSEQSPDMAFRSIAGAMENVTTQGDKVRLAFKLFDSEGVALVNTLAMGQSGLQAAADETLAFGTALSRVDTAKMEAANDAIYRIKQVFSGVINQITVYLSPLITDLAQRFIKVATESDLLKKIISSMLSGTLAGIGFVADAFRGWEVLIKGLQLAFSKFVGENIANIYAFTSVLIDTANLIPGINIEKLDFSSMMQQNAAATQTLNEEFAVLTDKPLPSDEIKKWVSETQNGFRGVQRTIIDTGNEMEETNFQMMEKSQKFLDTLRRENADAFDRLIMDYERDMEEFKHSAEIKEQIQIRFDNAVLELSEKRYKELEKLDNDYSKWTYNDLQKGLNDTATTYSEKKRIHDEMLNRLKESDGSYFDTFKAGLQSVIDDPDRGFKAAHTRMIETSNATMGALDTGFQSLYVDAIKGHIHGSGGLLEAFKSMAQNIIDVWINMIARMIAEWTASNVAGMVAGSFGLPSPTGAAATGAATGAGTSLAAGAGGGAALGTASVPGSGASVSASGASGAAATVAGSAAVVVGVGELAAQLSGYSIFGNSSLTPQQYWESLPRYLAMQFGGLERAKMQGRNARYFADLMQGNDGLLSTARSLVAQFGSYDAMDTAIKKMHMWNEFFASLPHGGIIPKFGDGGIVTKPTLAIVGERGPEAITPLNKMAPTVNVTINGSFLGDKASMNEFIRMIRQEITKQNKLSFGVA